MLQSVVLRASSIFNKKVEVGQKLSKLGFVVNPTDGGSIIEQNDAIPGRAIRKLGNGYSYTINFQPDHSDIKSMEIAKEFVIASLCALNPQKSYGISESMQIAKYKLSGISQPDKIDALSYLVAHDTAGYGPISILMEDKKNIEEIEINSPKCPIIVYSTKYGRCATNLMFTSDAAFRSVINRMIRDTEKELNENTPIIDAQVSDLRIHAQIKPYALSGAAASIRIGGRKEIDLGYLLRNGTATPNILAYLWLAMETKHNMILSGPPASGKTTLLNTLTSFIPSNEKVITIEEDINELKGTGVGNTIALYGSRYGSISPKEQVINSLRMRPSRIIIGEMRGEEAKDLFMGANVGISFAATMHSNEGGMQILKKLMVKPMGVDIRGLSALDLAIYLKQTDISRRSITGISEYKWLSRAEIEEGVDINGEDMVQVSDVALNSQLDRSAIKDSKVLSAYARMQGITSKEAQKELESRTRLIERSYKENDDPGSVEKVVCDYSGW